jgi:hypothetical protein
MEATVVDGSYVRLTQLFWKRFEQRWEIKKKKEMNSADDFMYHPDQLYRTLSSSIPIISVENLLRQSSLYS